MAESAEAKKNQQKVLIAVDGSEHSNYAVKCKYKFDFLFGGGGGKGILKTQQKLTAVDGSEHSVRFFFWGGWGGAWVLLIVGSGEIKNVAEGLMGQNIRTTLSFLHYCLLLMFICSSRGPV